jgi:hypothetical protein
LPATPETVAAFLASEVERGIRSSTIGRRVAALRYAHKLAGLPLPTDDERASAPRYEASGAPPAQLPPRKRR